MIRELEIPDNVLGALSVVAEKHHRSAIAEAVWAIYWYIGKETGANMEEESLPGNSELDMSKRP